MNEGVRRIKLTAIFAGILIACTVLIIAAGKHGNSIGFPELFVAAIAGFAVWAVISFFGWVVEGFTKKPQ